MKLTNSSVKIKSIFIYCFLFVFIAMLSGCGGGGGTGSSIATGDQAAGTGPSNMQLAMKFINFENTPLKSIPADATGTINITAVNPRKSFSATKTANYSDGRVTFSAMVPEGDTVSVSVKAEISYSAYSNIIVEGSAEVYIYTAAELAADTRKSNTAVVSVMPSPENYNPYKIALAFPTVISSLGPGTTLPQFDVIIYNRYGYPASTASENIKLSLTNGTLSGAGVTNGAAYQTPVNGTASFSGTGAAALSVASLTPGTTYLKAEYGSITPALSNAITALGNAPNTVVAGFLDYTTGPLTPALDKAPSLQTKFAPAANKKFAVIINGVTVTSYSDPDGYAAVSFYADSAQADANGEVPAVFAFEGANGAMINRSVTVSVGKFQGGKVQIDSSNNFKIYSFPVEMVSASAAIANMAALKTSMNTKIAELKSSYPYVKEIQGWIKDSSGNAIKDVNVSLYRDNSLLASMNTGSNMEPYKSEFKFVSPVSPTTSQFTAGTYTIKAAKAGYTETVKTINVTSDAYGLELSEIDLVLASSGRAVIDGKILYIDSSNTSLYMANGDLSLRYLINDSYSFNDFSNMPKFSPDGIKAIFAVRYPTSVDSSYIFIHDSTNLKLAFTSPPDKPLVSPVFAPDNSKFAFARVSSAGAEVVLATWNSTSNYYEVNTLVTEASGTYIYGLGFSNDGSKVYYSVIGADSAVKWVPVSGGSPTTVINSTGLVYHSFVVTDSSLLLLSSSSTQVPAFSIIRTGLNGENPETLISHYMIENIMISPDKTRILYRSLNDQNTGISSYKMMNLATKIESEVDFGGADTTNLTISSWAAGSPQPITTAFGVLQADFTAWGKIRVLLNKSVDPASLSNLVKTNIKLNGSSLDAADTVSIDIHDSTNKTLIIEVAEFQSRYSYSETELQSGAYGGASKGLEILAGTGIMSAGTPASELSPTNNVGLAIYRDITPPAAPTESQMRTLCFSNLSFETLVRENLRYPEKGYLEMCVSQTVPSYSTLAMASELTANFEWIVDWQPYVVMSIANQASGFPAGYGIYYRFKDCAGNISEWKSISNIPAPPDVSKITYSTARNKVKFSAAFGTTDDVLNIYGQAVNGTNTYYGWVLAPAGGFQNDLFVLDVDPASIEMMEGKKIMYSLTDSFHNESALANHTVSGVDTVFVPTSTMNDFVSNLRIAYNGDNYQLYNCSSSVVLPYDLRISLSQTTGGVDDTAFVLGRIQKGTGLPALGFLTSGYTESASATSMNTSLPGGTIKFTYVDTYGNESVFIAVSFNGAAGAFYGAVPPAPSSSAPAGLQNLRLAYNYDPVAGVLNYQLRNNSTVDSFAIGGAYNMKVYAGPEKLGAITMSSIAPGAFLLGNYIPSESVSANSLRTPSVGGGLNFTFACPTLGNESARYAPGSQVPAPLIDSQFTNLRVAHAPTGKYSLRAVNSAVSLNNSIVAMIGNGKTRIATAETIAVNAFGSDLINTVDAGGPLRFTAINNDSNESGLVGTTFVETAPNFNSLAWNNSSSLFTASTDVGNSQSTMLIFELNSDKTIAGYKGSAKQYDGSQWVNKIGPYAASSSTYVKTDAGFDVTIDSGNGKIAGWCLRNNASGNESRITPYPAL
ncbi:MAG: hypothetical protein QMC67_11560 [Candidatus Wallbacteria bacterium]